MPFYNDSKTYIKYRFQYLVCTKKPSNNSKNIKESSGMFRLLKEIKLTLQIPFHYFKY